MALLRNIPAILDHITHSPIPALTRSIMAAHLLPTFRFRIGSTTHVRFSEDQLVQEAMSGNVLLVSSTAQVRAAEVDQRIAKALRWPRLDLSSAYGINDQKNEVGVVLGTYTQGFNGGLTVSMPLFNGGRINTQVEAARLRAENAAIVEQTGAIAGGA